MTDASFGFLLFSAAVVVVFHLSASPAWKRAVLLCASLVFLVMIERRPVALAPLLIFTFAGYGCIRWFGNSRAGFLSVLTLFLAAFVWLKRYTFIPHGAFLPFPYLTVGLSYVLFRMLHLLIHGRNTQERPPSLLPYLTYTLNFTTLVSGPIQRFAEFDSMLAASARTLTAAVTAGSLERIIQGVFKVRVLAFLFWSIHEQATESALVARPLLPTAISAALCFSSYSLFLYCNFSGYIDVVIGISRLLGIELPENFDRPFSSDNFIQLWSRWHITLSTWLKDYVYVPLVSALMRRFPQRAVEPYLGAAAYFITFFLVGVWHGQTSEFVFFGFLQGLGVAGNKLFQVLAARRLGRQRFRELSANPYWCAVCRGLTFTWFTFTLAWFWSDWKQIVSLYSSTGPLAAALAWTAIMATSAVLLALWEAFWQRFLTGSAPSRYWRTAWSTALVVMLLAMVALLDQPAPEIVYGKF